MLSALVSTIFTFFWSSMSFVLVLVSTNLVLHSLVFKINSMLDVLDSMLVYFFISTSSTLVVLISTNSMSFFF